MDLELTDWLSMQLCCHLTEFWLDLLLLTVNQKCNVTTVYQCYRQQKWRIDGRHSHISLKVKWWLNAHSDFNNWSQSVPPCARQTAENHNAIHHACAQWI